MPNAIKTAILQKKIEGVLTTLYVQTSAENVVYDDASSVKAKLDAMQADLTAAEDQLTALVGDGTSGSIATMIQEKIDEAVAALENEEDPASLAGKIKAVADEVVTVQESITALTGRVSANEEAIATLNGDATTEGSVQKQVSDAVAAIVADAPEAYDTLVEISNWISTHGESAAAMNTAILDNAQAISTLETYVGALPEGVEATTVVAYIQEAIAALKTEEDEAVDTKIATAVADLTAIIDTKSRILVGEVAPDDMTDADLFLQVAADTEPEA